MHKRIVICFDGTWNTPSEPYGGLQKLHDEAERLLGLGDAAMRAEIEQVSATAGVETNVCRLYRSVLSQAATDPGADGIGQVKWYDKGVGTNWYDKVTGGAFGLGLSQKIREGYKFLSDTYDSGDEVFVFGFSRGAYTARSLIGFIRNCGLLPKGHAGDGPDSPELLEAYELYRARDSGPDSEVATRFRLEKNSPLIKIKFLGVWDTVGALGIPLQSFGAFNKEAFEFHDTELSGLVENAFHAVAVDEHREPYNVTLWTPKTKPDQQVEQCWFIGAHCDVGGGYQTRQLSDLTLAWMQEKASDCGLKLNPAGIPQVNTNVATTSVSDSFREFLGGVFSMFNKRFYRTVYSTQYGGERVDDTVRSKLKLDVGYRPKNPGLT